MKPDEATEGMATRADDAARGRGPRAGARRAHREDGAAARAAADGGAGVNVNRLERALSLVGGGALALYASRRRGWSALPLGLVAGALVERGVSGRCPVYGALGLTTAGEGTTLHPPRRALKRMHGPAATVDAQKAIKIEHAVTVYGLSPDQLYEYWRDLENLPRIFEHLESVTVHDATHSRWVATAPAGRTVEWEAEIVNDVPGELIGWKSLAGARVPNAGSVHFRAAPAERGTEVHVTLEYEPPAGRLGAAVARLFGEEPRIQVREDLRRFKALMEAGELPVSENPGQGGRAHDEFNARVSAGKTGADVRDAQRRARREAHEPRHVPPPADAMRGAVTTPGRDAEVRP